MPSTRAIILVHQNDSNTIHGSREPSSEGRSFSRCVFRDGFGFEVCGCLERGPTGTRFLESKVSLQNQSLAQSKALTIFVHVLINKKMVIEAGKYLLLLVAYFNSKVFLLILFRTFISCLFN